MKDVKGNIYEALRQVASYNKEDEELDEAKYTPKQYKMAFGVLNDPRWKGGNMTQIVSTIEKIAKGLSKDKAVAHAIQVTNEELDEDAELQEIRKAPQIKHLNIYGSEISGLRSGGKYYMAMAVDMKGKLMYKVIDEFGSIETIDLKTFAKKFG